MVYNDSTLSSIRRKQEVARYRPAGVTTGNANFAKLAEDFGMQDFRATHGAEVAKAVESWKISGGPCLLDVVVDFAHYRPMGY